MDSDSKNLVFPVSPSRIKREKVSPPREERKAQKSDFTSFLDTLLGIETSADQEDKKSVEPLKSSDEILTELFGVFNAAPPKKILTKTDKSKKKKHKKHKKKSKKKKREDDNESDSSSDTEQSSAESKVKAKVKVEENGEVRRKSKKTRKKSPEKTVKTEISERAQEASKSSSSTKKKMEKVGQVVSFLGRSSLFFHVIGEFKAEGERRKI